MAIVVGAVIALGCVVGGIYLMKVGFAAIIAGITSLLVLCGLKRN